MKKVGGMWDREFFSQGYVSFEVSIRYPSGDNKLAFRYMLLEFRKEIQAEDNNLRTKGIQMNLKAI